MKNELENVQCWNDLRRGNYLAFKQLYYEFYSYLYSYSWGIIQDRDLIKDALHDLFIELWKNHENLGETTNVRY